MLAVIFELAPNPGCMDDYLALAEQLKAELSTVDGFISVERFASLSQPGHYLSLSFWRDEQAVAAWRNLPSHRLAQAQGRNGLFARYRLRVARIQRDYSMQERSQAPFDSQAAHRGENGHEPA
ncbi:antibiotic biosynthesis monooxygenase family protein [Bowmanella dokdonensis]|uniref:Antibiotic biosynthesis monooxygenase n=1 Tax=Bowmanella dokdonensis TaxID=751969 RepID=A0A939DSM6_9ALTE|nr:antibiotic biosynthesis monooxygenase [Bowmanella dokdonensis]MBN7827171.1 antibiotic biosynthesis monooxygenase [Bowmanella dokdonensis]